MEDVVISPPNEMPPSLEIDSSDCHALSASWNVNRLESKPSSSLSDDSDVKRPESKPSASPSISFQLEAVLKRLEEKLDLLCDVPQQLQALQKLPKQIDHLAAGTTSLGTVSIEAPPAQHVTQTPFIPLLKRSGTNPNLGSNAAGGAGGGAGPAPFSLKKSGAWNKLKKAQTSGSLGEYLKKAQTSENPEAIKPALKKTNTLTSTHYRNTDKNEVEAEETEAEGKPETILNRRRSGGRSSGSLLASGSQTFVSLLPSTLMDSRRHSNRSNQSGGSVRNSLSAGPKRGSSFSPLNTSDHTPVTAVEPGESIPSGAEGLDLRTPRTSCGSHHQSYDTPSGATSFISRHSEISIDRNFSAEVSMLSNCEAIDETEELSAPIEHGESLFPSLVPEGYEETVARRSSALTVDSMMKIRSRYVLSPDSYARLAWDSAIIFNIILAAFIIPLLLVYFEHDTSPHVLDYFLIYGIDLLWPFDIALNCSTGFFIRGEVTHDRRKIIAHYAGGWMFADILSACPLAATSRGTTAYMIVCACKFPRLLQLGSRVSNLRSVLFNAKGILPASVVVAACISLHMMTCGWRLALRADGVDVYLDDIRKKYMQDLYWSSATLTSVGYGDIVPLDSTSYMYAICVMLLGTLCCGATVTGCNFFLHQMINNESEQMMSDITIFMRRRAVPLDLQRRVRDNLRSHLVHSESLAMAPDLLTHLSPAMQRELSLSILNKTVLQFPLFKNAQRSFVAELAQAHHWEQALSGDLVTDEGQSVEEVVFIIEGRMQALICAGAAWGHLDRRLERKSRVLDDVEDLAICAIDSEVMLHDDTVMELWSGMWFGEAALFENDRVYTSVISAATRCELAVLSIFEYAKVVRKYPWLFERHQSIERAIKAGKCQLKYLKHKDVRNASGIQVGGRKKRSTRLSLRLDSVIKFTGLQKLSMMFN